MPCSPATTCAAVTTRSGVANQPLPSTPIPHASPRMRTTDADARRTAGSAEIAGLTGVAGAAGPVIDGNGSIRASRCSSRRGGTTSSSRRTMSGVLHRLPQLRLAGQQQRGRAEHPDEHEPGRRTEQRAGGGVEEAERRQLQAVPQERAGEARHRLQQQRADRGADEAGDRRPRRGRAAVQQVRPDARARIRAGGEPGERERARDQPATQPAERRDRDDAERDPIHGRQRHAAQSRSRSGGSRLH